MASEMAPRPAARACGRGAGRRACRTPAGWPGSTRSTPSRATVDWTPKPSRTSCTSDSRPVLAWRQLQGVADHVAVGGEQAAEQVLLGGQPGGERLVAQAAGLAGRRCLTNALTRLSSRRLVIGPGLGDGRAAAAGRSKRRRRPRCRSRTGRSSGLGRVGQGGVQVQGRAAAVGVGEEQPSSWKKRASCGSPIVCTAAGRLGRPQLIGRRQAAGPRPTRGPWSRPCGRRSA